MDSEELKERLQQIQADNEAILAKAKSEGDRELTVEEELTFDSNLKAFDRAETNIQRLEANSGNHQKLTKPQGRVTQPAQPAQPEDGSEPLNGNHRPKTSIRTVPDYQTLKNGGFRTFGDFAKAVSLSAACNRGGVTDPRLERISQEQLASATTYGSEGVGADGGFAVPPDFRNAIMEMVLGEDQLLSRTDQYTTDSNQITFPADETTPWQTTGGIQAVWDGEAVAATQSKPQLQERTLKANKIRCLVPMTEESMSDASALDSYLRRKAPAKIAFKVNLALVQGTGSGQPLGLLNSPALVSVAKEAGQVADTLIGMNIIKMYSRLYAPSRANAVWLYNQDIEPQLYKLSVPGTDNEGNFVTGWGGLIYMPPGGLSGSPYGTIYGRPAIPTQACETKGDKGDIIFVDFKSYATVLKSGPNPRVETSMHLWFDQDLVAFKFVLRIGGMPWWSVPASARDGSTTYSPYVTLDERA